MRSETVDFARSESSEVGDARQPGNYNLRGDGLSVRWFLGAIKAHGVFCRQAPGVIEVGDDAERRPVRAFGDFLQAVFEQCYIATELVNYKAHDARAFDFCQHRTGADKAGDNTAPVDIGDQHHRHVGDLGKPHVGDIAGP